MDFQGSKAAVLSLARNKGGERKVSLTLVNSAGLWDTRNASPLTPAPYTGTHVYRSLLPLRAMAGVLEGSVEW